MEGNKTIHLLPHSIDLDEYTSGSTRKGLRKYALGSIAVEVGIVLVARACGFLQSVWSILFAFGMFVIPSLSIYYRYLTGGRVLPLTTTFYTVDRDGLGIRTEVGDDRHLKRMEWKDIRSVSETEHGILLRGAGRKDQFIPNTCFASEDQRRTVLTLARSSGELPATLRSIGNPEDS